MLLFTFIMVEGSVKIGAMRNHKLLEARVTQSRFRLVSISEALDQHYMTVYPVLVPTEPQPFTSDLLDHVTETADSRQYVIYLRLGKSVSKVIRAAMPTENSRQGQLIPLAEGISAHASLITSAAPDKVMSSTSTIKNNLQEDPERPVGAYPGPHFDRDGDLPIATRLEDSPRRLIVNLGPSNRESLIVAPYSMLDIVEDMYSGYPGYDEYVPRTNYPIVARLDEIASKPDSKVTILRTEIEPGEAVVLHGACTLHEGSTRGKGPSDLAVLFEPEQRWEERALINSSLFK